MPTFADRVVTEYSMVNIMEEYSSTLMMEAALSSDT
jgi:hypothetical protein